MSRKVTTFVPWFGSNRNLAHHVGEQLAGCHWVGVPFAGGMSELLHLTARTIFVNDLHRHLINLANVLKDDALGPDLIRRLRRIPFHEDTLAAAQIACRKREDGTYTGKDCPLWWATDYFLSAWMGRSGKAGTRQEFTGAMSVRWTGTGGDSVTRFRSAVEALAEWRRIMPRCTFSVMDVFAFLKLFRPLKGHGLYLDPPFPKVGQDYRHNAGKGAEERAWHTRLRDALVGIAAAGPARIVLRFYDHELVRELYPEPQWTWLWLEGGKTQANGDAPEVLVLNGLAVS